MRVVYTPPRQSVSKPPVSSGNFARTLIVVLVLAFMAAGLFHLYRNGGVPGLQQPLAHSFNPTSQSPNASTQPDAMSFLQQLTSSTPVLALWRRQELAEFSLEAPFTLTAQTPQTKGLNNIQLRQITERYRWQGISSDGFLVQAEFLQIDGTRTLSMEDGVKGLIRPLAEKMGDSAPVYRSVSTFVNGLAARRISYTHAFNTRIWHMETLIVQANRKMFFAGVIYPGETRGADADRVLNSVNIHIGR